MVSLDRDKVRIDADHFEAMAGQAYGSDQVAQYGFARDAYTGELLAEDRYADRAAPRRDALADLLRRLLLELTASLSNWMRSAIDVPAGGGSS